MKLIYITGEYIEKELPGVEKKIKDQIKVLEERGIIVERQTVSKKPRLFRALPFSSTFNWNSVKVNPADCLYIRMEPFSFPFLRMIKYYKKENPNTIIIIELATYPYDEEIKRLSIITQMRDKKYRKYLKKYVDCIVTYSNDSEIFGIKTIGIQNGIDVKCVPIAKGRDFDNEIHLLAVAALQPYHGYERVIEGLYNYYKNGGKKRVKFLIVGEGVAREELQALVQKRNLEDVVFFYGKKDGVELTDLFDQSDIGLGSFGLYKRNDSSWSSALKTREYLARGLPMISGCDEDVFQGRKINFYLEVANDNSPLDVNMIIDFYIRVYQKGKLFVSKEIREFAERNLDVRISFSPVVRYIEKEYELR